MGAIEEKDSIFVGIEKKIGVFIVVTLAAIVLTVVFIGIKRPGRNCSRFHIIILHKLTADDLTDIDPVLTNDIGIITVEVEVSL